MRIEAISPFLRWAGSKRQLLPKLIPYWDDQFSRYVEPFMGSACLFFAINPPRAVLGDVNEDLMRTFSTVRSKPESVANALNKIRPGKESYYCLRKRNPGSLSDIAAAARFIFLNRYCFNGLYRTNLAGQFNVPFASKGTGQLPTLSQLIVCAEALQNAILHRGQFESTLKLVKKGDFVYLDPPFAVEKRRVFREYNQKIFGADDLQQVALELDRMHEIGATFVLSYADCAEARKAFARWKVRRVRTRRNIAGFAIHRRHAFELIFTNRSEKSV